MSHAKLHLPRSGQCCPPPRETRSTTTTAETEAAAAAASPFDIFIRLRATRGDVGQESARPKPCSTEEHESCRRKGRRKRRRWRKPSSPSRKEAAALVECVGALWRRRRRAFPPPPLLSPCTGFTASERERAHGVRPTSGGRRAKEPRAPFPSPSSSSIGRLIVGRRAFFRGGETSYSASDRPF